MVFWKRVLHRNQICHCSALLLLTYRHAEIKGAAAGVEDCLFVPRPLRRMEFGPTRNFFCRAIHSNASRKNLRQNADTKCASLMLLLLLLFLVPTPFRIGSCHFPISIRIMFGSTFVDLWLQFCLGGQQNEWAWAAAAVAFFDTKMCLLTTEENVESNRRTCSRHKTHHFPPLGRGVHFLKSCLR